MSEATTEAPDGWLRSRRKPSPGSVREAVYEAIKARLMNNVLQPGTRLSIDGLARDLHVSQTPVREALGRCESEGLVIRRPNAGYQVTPILSRDALDDMYDIRLLLEPAAAGKAARFATARELAAIGRQIPRTTAPVQGDDYEAYRSFAEADAAFHAAIAQASRSPLMVETLGRFRAHTHTYRLFFEHRIATDAVTEHRAVLRALRAHDPDQAEAAMRTHLQRSRARLSAAYGE